MEKVLSLNEELDSFLNSKLTFCKCNPCECSNRTKELYYQELKDILSKFNRKYIKNLLIENESFMKEEHSNYLVSY